MTTFEVEVKFFIDSLPAFRQHLLDHDATLHKPRIFENNVCYDNGWQGLARAGKLLRLRQDSKVHLTYKGIPPEISNSEVKIREEVEIDIDDFEKTAYILQKVGFTPRITYQKYRETFVCDDVEVVLDELPFGNFVELEGTETAIKSLAKKLGLTWEQRILGNYLILMVRLKDHYGLDFDDITFENFAGTSYHITDIL